MTAKPVPAAPVFHEKHSEDQEVVSVIRGNIKRLIRSRAASRAWRTRKRLQMARQAAAKAAETTPERTPCSN